jgi:hypothetical protein
MEVLYMSESEGRHMLAMLLMMKTTGGGRYEGRTKISGMDRGKGHDEGDMGR